MLSLIVKIKQKYGKLEANEVMTWVYWLLVSPVLIQPLKLLSP